VGDYRYINKLNPKVDIMWHFAIVAKELNCIRHFLHASNELLQLSWVLPYSDKTREISNPGANFLRLRMDACINLGVNYKQVFVRQGSIMKGYITGVVADSCLILWQSHPLLSIMAALPLPMIVIAFGQEQSASRFEKS